MMHGEKQLLVAMDTLETYNRGYYTVKLVQVLRLCLNNYKLVLKMC